MYRRELRARRVRAALPAPPLYRGRICPPAPPLPSRPRRRLCLRGEAAAAGGRAAWRWRRRDVQLAGEAGRRAGARRRRERRGADGDRRAAGPLPPQAAAAGGALPLPWIPLARPGGGRLREQAHGAAGGAVQHRQDHLHPVRRSPPHPPAPVLRRSSAAAPGPGALSVILAHLLPGAFLLCEK